ncbi:MAG: type II secretion system F family protein [Defluviicoccus sp.]|nr:type II secretion system F family protein [Defluviicoccus sp.]MDE0382389.1 type II secretion system F family protein [Defluviicoccus sp.]
MSPLFTMLGGAAALLLCGAVAFALSRRGEKAFRQRLHRVSEPLTGRPLDGDASVDADIFRTAQTRSQSGRFWQFVQTRYPLLDPRRSVPRGIGIGILAGAGFWGAMMVLQIPSGWWTVPLVGIATVGGVVYAMSSFQSRQVAEFTRQFPETIDQIVRLSRAGVPALEAIAVISEDCQPPIRPILRNLCDGLLAGLDSDTALRTAAARVRLAEFTLFTSVIRLQRRSGGSISAAFANLSQTLRERRSIALKARASTAQTRLTLLVLSVMPVLVLIGQKFVAPKSIEMLFGTEQGNNLLHWGVGLIILGLLAAKFIASRVEK